MKPGDPLDVAIVGAGISGLACARELVDQGHRVHLFDKGRGVGGRMSTRRAAERRFDHGAQYFTVRDPRFRRSVGSWSDDGVVERWRGRIAVLGTPSDTDSAQRAERAATTERWIGVPGMSSVCRHLARDLDVETSVRIERLERSDGRWRLSSEDGEVGASFDAVVVSAPAPQTAQLLAEASPSLAARAAEAEIAPCWAVLASFEDPPTTDFDAAFVESSALSWVARNNSKPGRPPDEAWVLHAAPEWSWSHLDLAPETIVEELLAAFFEALGRPPVKPSYVRAHRWRFALPTRPLSEPCLFDPAIGLAACGDWCGGPRVEGAFLSGRAAAGRLLALRPGREPDRPSR